MNKDNKDSSFVAVVIMVLQAISISMFIVIVGIVAMPERLPEQRIILETSYTDTQYYTAGLVLRFKRGMDVDDTKATAFYLRHRDVVVLVTNHHVCKNYMKDAEDITVESATPGDKRLVGEEEVHIIASEPDIDLCLLTTEHRVGLSMAERGPRWMEVIYTTGFPAGLEKITQEYKFVGQELVDLGMGEPILQDKYWGVVIGGQSGSPVMDRAGNVVGVISSSLVMGPLNYGGAIPLNTLRAFIEQHLGQ